MSEYPDLMTIEQLEQIVDNQSLGILGFQDIFVNSFTCYSEAFAYTWLKGCDEEYMRIHIICYPNSDLFYVSDYGCTHATLKKMGRGRYLRDPRIKKYVKATPGASLDDRNYINIVIKRPTLKRAETDKMIEAFFDYYRILTYVHSTVCVVKP